MCRFADLQLIPLTTMTTYHRIRHEPAKLFYEDLYNQFVAPSDDDDFDDRQFNVTSSVILYTKLLD